MEFIINRLKWRIIRASTETLINKYNSNNLENTNFAFGVTIYPEHEIWINADMNEEQQIKTLKHELTHCYIWSCGLYNVPNFNEEMVCDLVSCINDFINEIVDMVKNK